MLSLPYPPTIQRGMNRLTLTCLRQGVQPPQGLMDLLEWCRRPLASWNLALPEGSVAGEERLLDGQLPTATCEAWARTGSDVEANLQEERLLLNVISVCKGANDPQAYTAFRRMLIEQPVMSAFTYQLALGDPVLDLLVDQLRAAYEPAPVSAVRNGQLGTCAMCGNLLLRTQDDQWVCEDEVCRAEGFLEPGRLISVRDDVVWLRRDLRRYIAAPGRAELRLAKKLERMGLHVELWPAFDRYDLRVTFPDETIWALDVKDWGNPFLLARSVNRKPFPADPPWQHAFFVFSDARHTQRSDYLRAFTNTCRILSERVNACFERDLLQRAGQKLQRGDYA
ncbi:MAG: hypothetical protein EOM24_33895 [Chloroflexia bacterium]|nr:hypothetical protein [Chloroflexia bacterium]